jgi:ribosomal protein S18 acetylase RimI-like enzyme
VSADPADGATGVLVRDATPADAGALLPLIAEMGVGFHRPSGADAAVVARYLEQPGYGILLALLDGEAVGFLAHATTLDLYAGGPTGEIVDLLVTQQARGNGIGSALVAEAVRRFEAAGCGEARVVTDADNHAARRVYGKAGIGGDLICLHRHFGVDASHD